MPGRGAVLALALLALLVLGGCADPTTSLIAAARVNAQTISLDQYLHFVEINKSLCQLQNQLTGQITAPLDWNNPDRRDDLAAVRRQSLEQLVTAELTNERATADHIAAISQSEEDALIARTQQLGGIPPSDLWPSLHSTADDWRLLAQQALQQQAVLRLTPTATTLEAHVEWIAVKTQATAEQVLTKLHQGADFATLAAQYSQDQTRSTGGDAGIFVPGQEPAALDTVFFHAPTGTALGPIAVTEPAGRLCFASSPGVEPPISAPQGPTTYYIVQVLSRDTTPIFNVPNQPNNAQDAAFANWVRQGAAIQALVDF